MIADSSSRSTLETNTKVVGLVCVVISSTGFGLIPYFATTAYRHGANPFGLLTTRFPLATLILLVLRSVGVRDGAWPRGRQFLRVLALGAIGYAFQAYCYFSALEYIPSSLDAILLYLFPGFVVGLGIVLYGDRPSPSTMVCVAVAFAGCVLVVGPSGSGQWKGIALGIGAALCYSCYIVASSRILPADAPITSLTIVMLGGSITYAVLAPVLGPSLPADTQGWSAAFGLALVGTVVGMGFFFAGLSRLGPADTSVVANVEPLVSVVVGIVVLNEELRNLQLLGGAVVLGAVTALAIVRTRRPAVARAASRGA